MHLPKFFLGLFVVMQIQAVAPRIDNETYDELMNRAVYRCPVGSITVTPSGVCIQTLIADNISVADGLVDQITVNTFSASDCVVANSIAVSSLTSDGVLHNDSSGGLSSSLVVNADIDPVAAIVDTKLATLSTAGKVANSATTATSANTASAIVLRDSSGNFSAGTITASLNGNATTATTATTATSVSGSLSGDVTGTQSATVVSAVGGQIASVVAAATVLANAAASANTANSIVRRSSAGGFSTSTISVADQVISNSLTVTPLSTAGVVHNNASGLLSSSLIVNTDIAAGAAIADTKLATISTAGKVANSATTAINTNTASAIVARDGSGNFATNMITIAGTTTNATDVATKSYVDSAVGVSGASANTPNTLVLRNASGNFSAGNVSVTDVVMSGDLVLTTDPSTSTAGAIMKGSNSFIHNTGTNNTFVGVSAGNFTTSGSGQNCALGKSALTANTTGANNTAIGFNVLNSCTTGSSNTAIGSGSGATLTTGSNNVYIAASAGSASESGAIRIGTAGNQTSCFISSIGTVSLSLSATAVLIDTSTGKLGVLLSSEKFKHNIKNIDAASHDILKLRPVMFTYKNDESNTEQFGLIAEEVDKVFPAIVVRDENGEPKTVQYHVLPVLLLNEMKKQQEVINQQSGKIDDLTITVEKIEEALAALQDQIKEFAEYIAA